MEITIEDILISNHQLKIIRSSKIAGKKQKPSQLYNNCIFYNPRVEWCAVYYFTHPSFFLM